MTIPSDAIPFVDAHVHFWDLDGIRYPWLTPPFSKDGPNGSVEAIARTYLPSDYRADMARWNVVGAVHVDAGADPRDALAETDWLEGVAALDGLPTAIVGFAPLDDPNIDAILAAQAAHPGVRGIRHIVNWHADPQRTYRARDVTRDNAWTHGFGQLASHGLSFDLQCYPGQMLTLAALFARHPDVPVIVNHMGMPVPEDPDGIEEWRRGMRALAANPHIATKISGVGFAWRDWTVARIRPLILEAIDIFGSRRCMFATDLPTDLLFGSVDRHLDAYHAIVADLTLNERRDLFARNADRIYRLDLPLGDAS